MISEKIELLGKGLYQDIPDTLTLKAIPTASELDYVGAEDFDKVMIEKILPRAVEEEINFHNLLEIDYAWVCRCLRFINYGPYYTTQAIFCDNCGQVSGEARVDLRAIDCKPLPEGFVNDIVITKDEFIDYKGDVHLHLPTIQEMLNAKVDGLFKGSDGKIRKSYARLCYMINSIGKEKNLSPVHTKSIIEKEFTSSDFIILQDRVRELVDYGLRAGGSTRCPRCGGTNAAFIALVDDRFLHPTVGDLRAGRNDRSARKQEDISGDQAATV